MIGETVVVRTRAESTKDAFNNELKTYSAPVEIGNVLVQPGASSDAPDTNRPEGITVALTLHFPKTYDADLRGALIDVRGHSFEVVGEPERFTAENCPTQWDYPVEVTRSDG